ncbi:MAG: CopG family transcriptional regulator [Ruminococcus sp.]|nr:CopG family transcriptional regulator [Ruminococcus sp.]
MTPKKKIGRPNVEKPLTIEVKARIDVETNERLVKYCNENNLTRTDVVRKGIEKVINEKK